VSWCVCEEARSDWQRIEGKEREGGRERRQCVSDVNGMEWNKMERKEQHDLTTAENSTVYKDHTTITHLYTVHNSSSCNVPSTGGQKSQSNQILSIETSLFTGIYVALRKAYSV
jgi:hypothetical protein